MNISDLFKMGAEIFINSKQSGDTGSGLEMGDLIAAMSGLAGGGRNTQSIDLSDLLSKMKAGGLGTVAESWLGDGSNEPISPEQVSDMLGADNIADFASKLGLSNAEAAGGLSEALPQMVDKASSGGSLLDSIGGVSGAIDLAGKLFGKK
jgi:uncharacterized protein YidB (DUF937 family)